MSSSQYAYQSEQQSVLRPYYQRWIWAPALRLIPDSVSPNSLTLISTLSAGISFLLAATCNHEPIAMAIAALLVFAYLSLDNMDGAHARRIGQSSRLGEFLDHWLDTLNNGFIMLGACLAVGLPPLFSLLVLAVGTLAFFSVQLELRHTGIFRMGRVADIEGNTAVSFLYILLAIFGPELFAIAPVAGGPNLGILLGCGVMLQALWTFVSAGFRLESGRSDCWASILGLGMLLGWGASGNGSLSALLTATFFANPAFTSNPILARLLGHSTRREDRLALACIALLGIGSVSGLVNGDGASWAAAGSLALLTSYHALRTLSALRAEKES